MGNSQRRASQTTGMGAGASTNGNNNNNNNPNNTNGIFGGGQPNTVRNGSELTAEQLQLLIQAGRLQYGGNGQDLTGGGNARPQQPTPQFRSAKVTKNPFNLKKNTVKLIKNETTGCMHVEFEFDAAEPCTVSLHYFSREYVTPEHLTVKFVTEPGVSEGKYSKRRRSKCSCNYR